MALTQEKIYQYVKDQADQNDLLEGALQSSTSAIDLAIELTIDDFNSEQPVTNYTLENFPSASVMMYGVLHHIANGEAERQLRNQITYSAQGMNANLDDKYSHYNQLSTYYRQLFDSKTSKLKQAINISQAWGGSSSPYGSINNWNVEG